jgi:hypothetical protein
MNYAGPSASARQLTAQLALTMLSVRGTRTHSSGA